MCKCIRNILVLLDSCWSCGGQAESWLTSTCPIILKFTHNVSGHLSSHLTPSPSVSGTSMSSKTPAGVLEDRQSLDWLLHVQSSWNLHTMFLAIFQVIWHHLQVCQEHQCPPRLLLESWRTGRVLTDFYMSNHLEIYTQSFWSSFKSFDTISSVSGPFMSSNHLEIYAQ